MMQNRELFPVQFSFKMKSKKMFIICVKRNFFSGLISSSIEVNQLTSFCRLVANWQSFSFFDNAYLGSSCELFTKTY